MRDRFSMVLSLCANCNDGNAPVRVVDRRAMEVVSDPSLRSAIERGIALAEQQCELHTAAHQLGTTGFVIHTLGFASYIFARWGDNGMMALQQTIAAGGDTDSIGAIVGAWCGARLGSAWIPNELMERLNDGPFGPSHLRGLARDVAERRGLVTRYSPMLAMLRNLALYPVVLAHGFRRLVPW
jgi:ADP-ribosyl-[dinitrogen reductase] hydrolase